MRYGSRDWFLQTPDEAREERRRRKLDVVAGLTVLEPAIEEEVAWTWLHMRPEEKREACEAVGFAREEGRGKREEEARIAHFNAAKRAERSFAVYHGGSLLAIAAVGTLPDGRKFLSMERTVNALARGHRFTWLRAYGPLGRWICGEYPDGVWTVTPINLPRALDVYRHAGAERTGETVTVGGREYWVLKLKVQSSRFKV